MPFIGQQPITGAYSVLDDITTSSTNTYNLLLDGGAYSPASANNLLVSLNGVIQKPGSSFTISGSQITFVPSSGTLSSSDSIDFIIALGDVLSVGTPTDGTVNASKLSTNAVETAKINANAVTVAKMASTLDLSSNTVTLNKNASALVHVASIDVSPGTTTYELNMDYDDFNDFLIIVNNIQGSSTSGNENLDVKFKMDGTLDNGESNPYFTTGSVEFANIRNLNSTDNMELFTTNLPNKHTSGYLHCTNFRGLSEGHPMIQYALGGASNSNNNYGHYTGSCGMEVGSSASNKQVTAMRFAYTAGNVTQVDLEIYGYKR